MKISCEAKSLQRALRWVAPAVKRGRIGGAVLLALDGERLRVSAQNDLISLAMSTWIEAEVEDRGDGEPLVLLAGLLSRVVQGLPSGEVSLALDKKALVLGHGRSETRLDLWSQPETLPTVGMTRLAEIDAQALWRGLCRVLHCAATEMSRPVLYGVDCLFEGTKLTLAAADGFRLGVESVELEKEVATAHVIVPREAVLALTKLLVGLHETVRITTGPESWFAFRGEDWEVLAGLIQGTFPSYKALIPTTHPTQMQVGRAELLRAVRQASQIAREGSNIIRLQMSEGVVRVSAQVEVCGQYQEELGCRLTGPAAKWAVNGHYMTAALAAMSEEEVSLEVGQPAAPGALRPVGGDGYVQVIMPMFVEW